MKLTHLIIQLLLALQLPLLQFISCSPPTRPDFPPRIGNNKNLRTYGTPKPGERFVLYLEASSRSPLSYKWYKDGIGIKGAENDSFIIDKLSSKDEGEYKCRVTALSAFSVSNPFRLKLNKLEIGNNPPKWTKDTMSVKFNAGDKVKLTLNDSCHDKDNDTLSFTLMPGKPDNDRINHGIYEFESNPEDESEYTISVKATDGKASSIGTIKIMIHRENEPPEFLENLPPKISITGVNQDDTVDVSELETLEFTVEILDPDKEDKPTFNKPENMPEGAEFDNSSGVFRYTPEYDVSDENSEKVFHGITFHATDNAVKNPLSTKFVFNIAVCDKKFHITAESGTGGSIDPSGTIKAEPGKNYTFTITPDSNWKIFRVLVNDNNKGAIGTYSFSNVQKNNSIKAFFKKNNYTLTVSSDENGTVNPEGIINTAPDTSIIITVNPNSGYTLERWEILQGNPEIKRTYDETFKVKIKNESATIKALFFKNAKIKSVAAGLYHTNFLKTDNTLWAVGRNESGQLGDGTTAEQHYPVKVFTEVDSVLCSFKSTFVIRKDKTLWATGYNKYGQLGLGDTLNRTSFTQIPYIDNIKAISSAANVVTMIVKADGTLCGAGSNKNYNLGFRDKDKRMLRFTQVPDMPKMIKVSTGYYHTIALESTDKLWGVGSTVSGELGYDSSGRDAKQFVELPGASDIAEIFASPGRTFILKNDNSLWGTGSNQHGELGDGTYTRRKSFVKIMDSVTTISLGVYHTLILRNDNSLWVTGDSDVGRLGNGSKEDIATPVKVFDNVKSIGAGLFHSIVLKNDNTLWGSGRNYYGQLGLGDDKTRKVFTKIIFK